MTLKAQTEDTPMKELSGWQRKPLRWPRLLATLIALPILALGLVGCEEDRLSPRGVWSTASPFAPQVTDTPSITQMSPLPTATPVSPTLPPDPLLRTAPVPKGAVKGEKIAFLMKGDLWLADVASGDLIQMTVSGNVNHLYGWSYDGTQLLIGVGKHPVPLETDTLAGTNLWVVRRDGAEGRPLTTGLEVMAAAWSPTDDRIVYGTRNGEIHLINSDGTGHRTLPTHSRGMSYLGAWSPDGTQIAYRIWDNDANTVHLMVFDLKDGSRRRLASEKAFFVGYLYSYDIQWSLDGSRILFQSRDDPKPCSWRVVHIDGDSLIRLDNETLRQMRGCSLWAPRSPVADRVLFSAYDPSFEEIIWMMDFEGQVWEVTRGSSPIWSPDGSRVAYIGENDGLWVARLDGTDAIKFSSTAESPFWSR